MKNKTSVLISCLLLTTLALSACGTRGSSKVTPLPVATANPNITTPQGQYYEVEGKLKAEGGLAALGEDFLKLMIEGKEVEFALSKRAIDEIAVYNKDKNNLLIKRGTMLLITYTKNDLIYTAESIEILIAN